MPEKNRAPSLLSRWISPDLKQSSTRKLAALSPNQCFRDSYSVTTLKNEMLDLEENYKDLPPVQGSWRHLDLATLPVPQANFLLKFGSVIGDRKNTDSIDYSGCRDVPCLFNRIYNRTNEKAGYVHYLWYLRFGNLLAADNMVPGQKSTSAGEYQDKSFKLSQYLWLENELYGFWRISHSLPADFTQLKFLKEIQRIPPGEWQEGNTPDHCGQASNSGYIVLMDDCLKMPSPDEGYFYISVTHELGHHLDFTRGNALPVPTTYFSYSPEYLEIAEIDRQEYDDNGKTVVQYVGRPGARYINDYAKTSPKETYAEMIGYSRFNGEKAKSSTSPSHFDFIRNSVFNGNAYDNESYWSRWGIKYLSLVDENVLRMIVSCQQNPQTPTGIIYLSSNDLPSGLDPLLANCLQIRSKEISDLVYQQSMIGEPEGCILTSTDRNHAGWMAKIKELILASLSTGLKALQNDDNSIAQLASFLNPTTTREVRDLYLQCLNTQATRECFEHSLAEYSLKVSPSPAISKLFLANFPADQISREVALFYRVLLDSSLTVIKNQAEKLWNSCKSIPADDSAPPSGRKFTIPEGYMVSSLYNCLNAGFDQSIKDILSEIRYGGQVIINGDERNYLRKDFFRELNSELGIIYLQESQDEKTAALQIEKNLRVEMTDFSWVKVGTLQAGCREKVSGQIPFEPYFALKKNLFKTTINTQICQRLSSSASFSKWVEDNQERLKFQVTDYLQSRIVLKGKALHSECQKNFPEKGILDSLLKSKFDRCFEDGWKTIEEQTSDETSHVDLAFKLKISYEKLLGLAAANRKHLMKSVKQEKP